MKSYLQIIKEVFEESINPCLKKQKMTEKNTFALEKDILSDEVCQAIIKGDKTLIMDLMCENLSIHREILSPEQLSYMKKSRSILNDIKQDAKVKDIHFNLEPFLHPENRRKIFKELESDGWSIEHEHEIGQPYVTYIYWYPGYVIAYDCEHKMRKDLKEQKINNEKTFEFEKDILSDRICEAIIKGDKNFRIDLTLEDLSVHKYIVSNEQMIDMKKSRDSIVENIKQGIIKREIDINIRLEPSLHSENKRKIFEELINDGWLIMYEHHLVDNNSYIWYAGYDISMKNIQHRIKRESDRLLY